MSLNDWPLLGEHRFVGLDNYKDIAVDPLFWKVFGNTAYFTLGLVPFNIVLALMLALLLSRSLKGIGIFRTAIFVPVMTSLIVWSIVWKYMFATDSGLINQLLMLFNIKGAAWLYDETGNAGCYRNKCTEERGAEYGALHRCDPAGIAFALRGG